jgi:hypothetical protein
VMDLLVYDGERFSGFDWNNGDPNYYEILNSATNVTNEMDNNSNTDVSIYGPVLHEVMSCDGNYQSDSLLSALTMSECR